MKRMGSLDQFTKQVTDESGNKGAFQADAGRVADRHHEAVADWNDRKESGTDSALGKDSGIDIQAGDGGNARPDQLGAERFRSRLIRLNGLGKLQHVPADGRSHAFNQGHAHFDDSRIVLLQLNGAPQFDVFQHTKPKATGFLLQKVPVNQFDQLLKTPRLEQMIGQRSPAVFVRAVGRQLQPSGDTPVRFPRLILVQKSSGDELVKAGVVESVGAIDLKQELPNRANSVFVSVALRVTHDPAELGNETTERALRRAAENAAENGVAQTEASDRS